METLATIEGKINSEKYFECLDIISLYQPCPKSQNLARNICTEHTERIIESMMGLRPRQGNLRLVFRLFSLMRGFPCRGLNPIIDYFSHPLIFSKAE